MALGSLDDPMQGKRICHLSSVRTGLDPRAFHVQCTPLVAQGLQAQFVGPHGLTGWMNDVELVPSPRRANRFLRILLAVSIIPRALRLKADVYHFHDPELIPAGLLLKRLFGKKVVYDAEEDFPSMMRDKRYLPRPVRWAMEKLVTKIEDIAAHWLDGIVTADTATMRRMAKVGVSRKLVFFNLPNLALFPEPPSVPKKFDLIYRGGLSQRAGTLVLLQAIRQLFNEGRSMNILLIGYFDNIAVEKALREQIRSLHLDRFITLLGHIPHDKMAEAISEARIGICPLQPTPKFLRNIPVKVWEYWACGLPVVASDLAPIRPFFRDGEYGFLVKPDDPREFAQAIGWLMDHPEEAAGMGRRGRRVVLEHYNNVAEVQKLMNFYQRILET